MDTNSTQLAAIVADTNELQTNQGNWLTATGFATSTALATAQNDLDKITGLDGATLATAQALYAPNKVAPDNTAIANIQTQIGTAGAGLTDLGGMSTGMKAEVNAEVVDTLSVDTYAEPGQGAPGTTITLAAKINYLYKAWRNKSTQTATTYSLFDDAGTTVDQKLTVSDDGTTASKGEVGSGP
jgi:hypothetical protein